MDLDLTQNEWKMINCWFTELVSQPLDNLNKKIESVTSDPRLKQALASMINVHLSLDDFTITPKHSAIEVIQSINKFIAGDVIDRFKIIQLIGKGGMGHVYLAERSGDVAQKVAIKVLNNPLSNHFAKQRFEVEQQIVSQLEHPCIARLIDSGTINCLPYYAMEYVKGMPIDDYCLNNDISLEERLSLFLQLCSAVSHAHSYSVIHRDLKPSNILITANGDLKLLDFGIAKPLKILPGTNKLLDTIAGESQFTPQYAAPEQFVNGTPSMATDTYVLGLLLYRIITNQHAFDFNQKSWGEIENIISTNIPPAPSNLIKKDMLLTRSWRKQVEGDLDAIVTHSLKKEPEARYATVREMASDINSFLKNDPISIKKNHSTYRLKKTIQKHWVPVTLLSSLFLILIISTGWISHQSILIKAERNNALMEQKVAEQATGFLVEIFRSADPKQSKGERLSARDILNQGVYQLNNQSLNEQVKNRIRVIITEVFVNLGEFQKAGKLIEKVNLTNDSEYHPKQVLLQADVWMSSRTVADTNKALKIIQDKINSGSLNQTESLEFNLKLAKAYMVIEDYERSEQIYENIIDKSHELFGEESIEYAHWLVEVASINYYAHKYQITLDRFLKALETHERFFGSKHLKIGEIKYLIAQHYSYNFHEEKAYPFAIEAIEIFKNVYGAYYPQRVPMENLMASIQIKRGKLDLAENHYLSSLEMEKNHFSNNLNKITMIEYNLSSLYLDQEKYKKAIQGFERSIKFMQTSKGKKSHRFYYMRVNLIRALLGDGQDQKALNMLNDTIAVYEKKIKESKKIKADYVLARSYFYKGQWLMNQGNICEAKSMFKKSIPQFAAVVDESHSTYIKARSQLDKINQSDRIHNCALSF